jgi:phage-related minor tail protein
MAISLPIVSKFDDKGINQAESGIDKLGKGVIGLAKIGAAAAAATAAVGVAFVVASAKQLMEIEKLNAQTNAAITSTGGAAGKSVDQINKLNASLEKLTGIEAEVIQQGQNMLLTFTNIKGDQFDEATEAALNLSVALGKDMASSAMLVGKALNDPIAGLSALSRAGIQFTDSQKETIKSLVELGDIAGAQTIILAELEKQFGGSAEAFGETTAGMIAKFQNELGELGESIAAGLMPAVDAMLPELIAFVDSMQANPEFDAFVKELGESFGDMLPRLLPVLENFTTLLMNVLPGINPLLDVMGGLLTTVAEGMDMVTNNSGNLFSSWSDLAYIIANVNSGLSDWNDFINDITINTDKLGYGAKAAINAFTVALNPLTSGLKAIADLIRFINGTPVKNSGISYNRDGSLNRDGNVLTPFAKGGIVTGPTPALVGEAGPEAIIPLDRFDDVVGKRGGANVNIIVNAGMGTDGAAVGEQIVNAIRRYERTSGAVFARA